MLDEYAEQVKKQILSGWVGPHKATEYFEKRLSEIAQVKHAISTTSGTVAIMMGLEALGLPKGSTILFPSYTFLAGANAARFLGYKVELVDIHPDTLCMDPEKIHIHAGVSCVMFVNHNGYCGDHLREVRDICDSHGISMLEDSSQALGIAGAGTVGDIGILSFSVPKLVTTGQGGAVLTSNDDLAIKVRQIRDHGDNWRASKIHENLGVNFKFNDLAASLGNAQLDRIDDLLSTRARVFDAYREHLPLIDFGLRSTWMALYRTANAGKVIEKLKENNIQAVQYYRPLNHNPIYASDKTYPVADAVYKEVVYLPSSLNLSNEEIYFICSTIAKVDG